MLQAEDHSCLVAPEDNDNFFNFENKSHWKGKREVEGRERMEKGEAEKEVEGGRGQGGRGRGKKEKWREAGKEGGR